MNRPAQQEVEAVRPWRLPRSSVDRMLAWVRSPAVVGPDGSVLSWAGPSPGYPYPEAAGLWLAVVCTEQDRSAAARRQEERVADWLAGEAFERGAVGRDGADYLFDSAAALNGLIAHARAMRDDRHSEVMARLFEFVAARVRRGEALRPASTHGPLHWSSSYGAHQLKVVVALHNYADLVGAEEARALADDIVRDQLPLFDGGRFVIVSGSDITYLHGGLYALEGLAYLDGTGRGEYRSELERAAGWLASRQRASGGLPAHFDGRRAHGPTRTDATVQAARIWAYLDADRWETSITGAMRHLCAMQDASGGLRYADDCGDLNTWASLFAIQANRWLRFGPSIRAIV